jgi:dTMP kinase
MAVRFKKTPHRRGKLITFEGIDGCGKSTQLAKISQLLRDIGYPVITLREPGSTQVSEKIRNILLHTRENLSDATELLLYEAARAELTKHEILPHLADGAIVLCDRFYDSTTAYQGYGRKLDLAMVCRLHKGAVGNLKPDLTLVFDVALKTAYKRRGKKLDRLESQSRAFFERVRKGYHAIARREPGRVKMISAEGTVDHTFDAVRAKVFAALKRR